MITWVNFIHIYQPPWQNPKLVRAITSESYELLVGLFKRFPNFRATFNIAGTLLDTLASLGFTKLINDVNELLTKGRIELTGSSQFHAFLPRLPAAEIQRQIQLQENTLARHFKGYRPHGFFLPEMAYSSTVGKIIKERGYEWIILDPISMQQQEVSTSSKYISRRTGLMVVFRNRQISRGYPPEEIFKLLNRHSADRVIITATDGELYGHFHKDWQDHLKRILRSNAVAMRTVSEHLKTLTQVVPIRLRQASWETRSAQIRTNNPFTIWYNRSNPIHRGLWKLTHYAIETLERNASDSNFRWARSHLDRGLASCSFWWASEIKTSPFAPIAWNPDEIEKGALELIKSVRSLHRLSSEEKIRAEKMYLDLLERIWTKHWNQYGKK